MAQLQTASSCAAHDVILIRQGSVVPAASDLYAPVALPRTPINLRHLHELPGGGYQRSDPGSYSLADQVSNASFRPRAHQFFDLLLYQFQHAADQNVLQVSDVNSLVLRATWILLPKLQLLIAVFLQAPPP